jgi:hypothetical protein
MLNCTEQKKKRDKVNIEKKKSGMYEINVSISTFHVYTNTEEKENIN